MTGVHSSSGEATGSDKATHHARHAKGLVNDELWQLAAPVCPAHALGHQVVEQAHQLQALACKDGGGG